MAGYGQGTYGAGTFGVGLIRKIAAIIRLNGNLLVQRKAGRTSVVRRGRGRR